VDRGRAQGVVLLDAPKFDDVHLECSSIRKYTDMQHRGPSNLSRELLGLVIEHERRGAAIGHVEARFRYERQVPPEIAVEVRGDILARAVEYTISSKSSRVLPSSSSRWGS
jgi:hypothetical protein